MFQDVIASAISEIPNGKKISDDVIIYGVNRKEHKTLHAVLTRDKKLNLSLRKDINFFGLVFSGRGMSPDPAKIEATQKADPFSSVIDVRSLSGMTNYMSRFIRDYADIVAPYVSSLTTVLFKWERSIKQLSTGFWPAKENSPTDGC